MATAAKKGVGSTAKKKPGRCKAKDDRTGRRCTNKATVRGMCRRCALLHPSTGPRTLEGKAKVAASIPRKLGIYSTAISEEEKALLDEVSRMGLVDELGSMRLRYLRLQREERNILAGTPTMWPSGEDTTRTVDINAEGVAVPTGRATVVRKMESLSLERCHQLMSQVEARITTIETKLAEIASAPRPSDDPYEDARAIRDALKGMASLTGGEAGEAAYEPDKPANGSGNGNGNGKSKG